VEEISRLFINFVND